MNPLIRKYKYTIDWINSKGEMVQNIIDAKSMQEAMKKLQILRGKKFSKSGFGRPSKTTFAKFLTTQNL